MLNKTFLIAMVLILAVSSVAMTGQNRVLAEGTSGAPSKPVLEGEGLNIAYNYSGGKLTGYNLNDYIRNTGATGQVMLTAAVEYSDGTKGASRTAVFTAQAGKQYHISFDVSFLSISGSEKQTSYVVLSSANMSDSGSDRYTFEKTLITSIGEIRVEEVKSNDKLADLKVYSGDTPLKLEQKVPGEYSAYVDASVASVKIAAVAEDADAAVYINDQLQKNGEKQQLELKNGSNEVSIKIVATDGVQNTVTILRIVKSASTSGNKWTRNYDYVSGIAAGKGDMLYAVTGKGGKYQVIALTAEGTEKILYTSGEKLSGPRVGSDGNIYVWTESKLIALNGEGKANWTYDAGSNINKISIASDSTVFLGIFAGYSDEKLAAISPAGKKLWEFNTGFLYTDIFTGPDNTYYYAVWDMQKQDDGYMLYSLEADGTRKWGIKISGSVKDCGFDGSGSLYASLSGKKLAVIDTKDGSVKANYSVDATPDQLALGTDGSIYVTAAGYKEKGKDNEGRTLISEYGLLYALNRDGTKKWEADLGETLCGLSIAPDGSLYVSSSGNMLCRVNTAGAKEQDYLTTGPSYADPVVMAGGTIIAAATENKIFAFSR